MNPKQIVAVPAALLILGNGVAMAGKTVEEVGAFACVTDQWKESEPDKGHKLVDYASRCVVVPDDAAATPTYAADCAGKYEYKPDGSWKGAVTCTGLFKGGDKRYETLEEGSHLKEYLYNITGGTGKYQGTTGGGTCTYESVSDTLSGGRYKGKRELP
jgi:hypothetical protein